MNAAQVRTAARFTTLTLLVAAFMILPHVIVAAAVLVVGL